MYKKRLISESSTSQMGFLKGDGLDFSLRSTILPLHQAYCPFLSEMELGLRMEGPLLRIKPTNHLLHKWG